MAWDGDVPVDIVKGTCQTMCPVAELQLREKEGLLHHFEISNTEGKKQRRPKGDPSRAVKSYSRPAAGRVKPSPDDVRPAPVLLRTVRYLFHSIVPISHGDWVQVYDFVFDRLRAVRQDAVLQALHGPSLITLLEHIVRFHVYAGYRLCEHPAETYDAVINNQHLLECLKQLLRLYEASPGPHPHQPLFEAVYLLHNLGSQESCQHGLSLSTSLRNTTLVQEALAVNMAFLQGNYVRVLRKCLQLSSPLCLCAVHRHFHHIHIRAVRVMSVAYSSKACRFPLTKLQRLLHLTWPQLLRMLQACQLLPDIDPDRCAAQHVTFLKASFSMPSKVEVCRQPELDDQLQTVGTSALLLGPQGDVP